MCPSVGPYVTLLLFGLLGATYAVFTVYWSKKMILRAVYPLNLMRARYENEEEEKEGVGLDLLIRGLIVGF